MLDLIWVFLKLIQLFLVLSASLLSEKAPQNAVCVEAAFKAYLLNI